MMLLLLLVKSIRCEPQEVSKPLSQKNKAIGPKLDCLAPRYFSALFRIGRKNSSTNIIK